MSHIYQDGLMVIVISGGGDDGNNGGEWIPRNEGRGKNILEKINIEIT